MLQFRKFSTDSEACCCYCRATGIDLKSNKHIGDPPEPGAVAGGCAYMISSVIGGAPLVGARSQRGAKKGGHESRPYRIDRHRSLPVRASASCFHISQVRSWPWPGRWRLCSLSIRAASSGAK